MKLEKLGGYIFNNVSLHFPPHSCKIDWKNSHVSLKISITEYKNLKILKKTDYV